MRALHKNRLEGLERSNSDETAMMSILMVMMRIMMIRMMVMIQGRAV